MVELEPEKDEIELLYKGGEVTPCWTCSVEDEPEEDILAPFAAQWLDTFRRNCWLSGGDIEASAHEKAEWMQGFSPEEVEAWNLKV